MQHHDLLAGLVRIHILGHAARHSIYGQWIIYELARHGYRLSPGTLYPLLDALGKKGLLRSTRQMVGGRFRRVYRATPAGRKALKATRHKVKKLCGELFEVEL